MLEQVFSEYLQQLDLLTDRQRTRLALALSGSARPSLGETCSRPSNCPRCGADAEQLHPWGQSHGLPRYRCHDCGRTCNALTGTPLAHLRKRKQWSRYAQAISDRSAGRARPQWRDSQLPSGQAGCAPRYRRPAPDHCA